MSRFEAQQAAAWTGGTWSRPPARPLEGVGIDTRRLREGMVFAALPGSHTDGHHFIDEALARGAGGVLAAADRTAPDDARPVLRVADVGLALQRLAAAWRREVAPLVIGITGSAGKTTVKEMTAAILSEVGCTVSTCGNWNNAIGLPLSLLAMERDTRFGVFEAGSNHPGEIAALCAVMAPDWGVVTNIGPAHLEFFGSLEGVAREKGALVESLPADGVAVLERGPWFDALAARTRARVVVTALEGEADYTAGGEDSAAGTLAVREHGGASHTLPLPLPGRHQVSNVLQSVAIARAAGAGWDAIATGLKGFRSLPMRWDVTSAGGVTIVNDAYNANPASMRSALEALNDCAEPSRCWLVLGDMLELGEGAAAEHEQLGRTIGAGRWAGLVAVGPLGARLGDGAEAAGMPPARVTRCAGADEAARWLAGRVRPGQWVLLKASRGIHLEHLVNTLPNAMEGQHHG